MAAIFKINIFVFVSKNFFNSHASSSTMYEALGLIKQHGLICISERSPYGCAAYLHESHKALHHSVKLHDSFHEHFADFKI